jgi:hypothetical protein
MARKLEILAVGLAFLLPALSTSRADDAAIERLEQRLRSSEEALEAIVAELRSIRADMERARGTRDRIHPSLGEAISVENADRLRRRGTIDSEAWRFVWSHDRSTLAVARWERPVILFDGETLERLEVLSETEEATHFAFGPDSGVIAWSSNVSSDVTILDRRTGERTVLDAGGLQGKLAFSPDGSSLVTGCYGTEAIVWDLNKRRWRFSLIWAARKAV